MKSTRPATANRGEDALRAQLTCTLLLLKLANKSSSTLCSLLEKHALYGTLENFKEQKTLAYKRLKSKEMSEQQEQKMIEEINRKFGGIDLILSKAALANPAFAQEGEAAVRETQATVSVLREEHKQNEETKDRPEALCKKRFLKTLPKGGNSNVK